MADSDSLGSENTRIPLSQLESGEKGRVCGLQGEATLCSRLREIGFCESAVVEKVSGDYTLLCQVCGSRVALNRQIAKNIVVEKID